MPTPPVVEIMTIGDELLYGQVIDTNSAFMGQELGKLGLRVRQITSVSDFADEIVATLDQARQRADVVLMTGGLGPTKDDLTKHVLARYFGAELVLHEPTLRHVEGIFARYNRPMLEVNRQQALVPSNCTVLHNALGTAPGMWFEDRGTIFVSMPGVPFEMKGLMKDEVLPRLQQHFQTPPIEHVVVQTVGLGESYLAEKIADWENALPGNIKLAYLPSLGGLRLRLSGYADGQPDLRGRMEALLPALRERIGEVIFAVGEVPLEQAVGQLLLERGLTVGTAESCTGGYVAYRLSSVPGSSRYYQGSVVAYSNDIKMRELGVNPATLAEHGAVSEATVREMAEGLRQRLGVDVAIATSGIAGPDGGTPTKPVGTICIAYADKYQTVSRQFSFDRGRQLNVEYTSTAVLNLLRLSLPVA
ncbi:competence/damage-inducible protein A [Hymenobacter taeanensis]|uniref:CinA-like protein n=1 Tax=Hymenobacter taeanensis TaxID=2735321 RepID=A0A6M6BK16_9BACT|nr:MULTISPECIES: competence/damage-inducible protein A [Hymenobacter]QJX48436.1 competence/damage-inducible protein A [Hymenobacter taeanensis]UOQ82070.1 competence/damage-inducible protein A [Hymenobacter sp. 5414T-23]